MTPNKQVSPVIRISQGERDASARATHLEAATRKFLVTTNERKQMSTKTNFKRIALVAVAALGMGVLSSVPSQAAVIGVPTVTATNGTATIGTSDSTTAATLQIKFNATASADSVVVRTSLGSQPASGGADTSLVRVGLRDTLTASGANHTTKLNIATAAAVGFPTEVAAISDQFVISAGAGQVAAKFYYNLDTAVVRVAGTYTIDYFTTVYSAGVAVPASAAFGQMLIVVTDGSAAADGAVAAAGTSTAVMYTGSSFGVTNVDSSVSVVSTPSVGTASAVIRVTQKTAAGLAARESITVTTTVGNVGERTAASGKSVTFVANANGINDIGLFADGSSGTAVITIKTTSVTFANKAATFFGTQAATITATALATTIGSTSTNAILAVAKDAAGNNIRSADAVYAYSDAVSVINTGTAPAGTSCGTYNSTYSGYLCPLVGANNGTANITIRDKSTSTLSTVASTAVAIKVNTAPSASVKLEFDKATYAPGEVAYIIVRPLDVAGAAIGATTVTNLFATGGITSTVAFGNGSETAANLAAAVSPDVAHKVAAVDGYGSATAIQIYKVYMPSSGGAVTIKATGGSALPSAARVAVSATATVTDSGAAALAAVTALATTVASLKTLITTLTNLVLKIQKKVKA
jgi:trimeric autotransporter adhesin